MAFCQVTAENSSGIEKTILKDSEKFVFKQEY